MANDTTRSAAYGGWLMAAASVIGVLLAFYYYLDPDTGVAYSVGAAIVVVSSALLAAASLVIALDHDKPVWLIGFLYVATLLDLLGTGLAAYFLDAYWLLAAMIVGLIGWLIHLILDPSDEELAANAIRREILS